LSGGAVLIGIIVALNTGAYWKTAQWTVATSIIVWIVGRGAFAILGWIVAGFAGTQDDEPAEPGRWIDALTPTLASIHVLGLPLCLFYMVPWVASRAAAWFIPWSQGHYLISPTRLDVWGVEFLAGGEVVIGVIMLWVLAMMILELALQSLAKSTRPPSL
jgi:hypothetical protein